MRRIAQRLLTLAALLGAVSLGVVLLCAVSGVRPVVIQSGSMGEALPTGSLAFQRSVNAASVAVGDIVTVPALGSANALVTHRVTALGKASGKTALTLKGDANSVPDPGQYVVDEADRVFLSVPHLGSVLAWVMTPSGILALLGYTALMVTLIARTQPVTSSRTRGRGVGRRVRRRAGLAGLSRRTRVAALAAAGAITAAAIGVPTAYGAWNDNVVAPATVGSGKILGPSHYSPVDCSNWSLLIVSGARLEWKGVETTALASPPVGLYEYHVKLYVGTTLVGESPALPHAGGLGGERQGWSLTTSLVNNLLSLNLLSSQLVEARVVAKLWASAAPEAELWESGPISFWLRAGSFLTLPGIVCASV